MTIAAEDRDLAVAHLMSRYVNLANEVGQTSVADETEGWKPDLDQADSRMGGGGFRLAYYALCEYFALERFHTLISTRVDTEAFAIEGDRETIFANVERLRKRMAAIVAGYGYPVDMTDLDTGDIGSTIPTNSEDIVGEVPEDGGVQTTAGLTRDWITLGDTVSL